MAACVVADNAFLRSVAEPGSPLEVHDFGPPTGRGFRCSRRASEGEVLLRIPHSRCVTAEVAAAEVAAERPELAALAEALPASGASGEGATLTAQDWLCLWLVQERRRGAASRHVGYVASLPRDCAEMSAAFWPAGCSALEALAGCSALVRLEDLRERVDAAHARVLEAIGGLWAAGEPPCGLDEYRWARCVLNSRQFGGTAIAHSAHLGMLVPGVEFANHSTEPHAAIRQSPDEAAVELVALREVAEGEEMMISYGRVGSAQLLAERGFAIEGNPDDAVDIFMEVPCGGARGQVVARCLGEDGCDADATSREVHLELSRQSPLPELLLAQSCLQSLGDDAVARLAASWDGQLPLPCLAEVRRGALLQLLGVAHAMLGRFETSLQSDLHERAQPRDAAAVDARLAMAVCARLGEKEVLAATAREVVGRLLALLEELEGRDEARTGGSAWWRLLNDSAGAVAAAQQRTVAHFQLLQATPLGDSATTASTLVQAGSLIFMWLHDLLRHPCRQAVDGPAAAARWLAWAEEAAEKQNPQLSLLFEKVAFWGAYLLAQFAVCGAFDLSALNTMQQESLDVRQRQCCCVPSRAALRLLGRFAPLLLVGDDRAGGDGPGPWAQLLLAQGVDVEEAAPPSADLGAGALAAARARCAGRTLVLLAVDRARGGGGPCAESAAAACLRAYSGETLLLVGEWRGHTFGLHGAAGGSFAAAFQEGVAAAFWEEASEPLPCWPLALDRVSVWRRRGAA